MCNHELKYLVGVAGGVMCKNCGQYFNHIPKQEKAPEAPVAVEEKAEEKPVKKAPARKTAAKKGAKA